MKKSNIYISMIMLLSGCLTTIAQEPTLTKEITIETDFVPVEQKATKLNKLPEVTKTTIPTKNLNYSNWSGTVDFPTTINTLEPYGYKTKYPFSKAKGYFDFGIGTQLNIVGSAGYKFIDTGERQLNAWLQHNSTWAGKDTSPIASANPLKQKFNDNLLAVNFSNKFDAGLLDLGAYFHLDNFNYYGVNYFPSYNNVDKQTATEFELNAGWRHAVTGENNLQFAAQLAFNHFGYSKNLNNEKNGLQENHIQAKVFSEAVQGTFSLGINASADFLGYSNMLDENGDPKESDWMGLFKVSPYVLYKVDNLDLKGGINVDLSANDGSKIRISPNIKANYLIQDGYSVYAAISGGKRLNLLSEVHSMCRYIAPCNVLGSSYSPFNAELGVKIGAFNGFYIKPFFGYGSFKDEMTPYYSMDSNPNNNIITEQISPYVFMQKYEIKGWKAGMEIGYNYNNIVDFTANVQYAPQDNDKGYSFGFDRPEFVVNAGVKVTPIKPLSITLGYELRNGRAYYNKYSIDGPPTVVTWSKTELNDVNNLSLNAYYQITPTIGAFINANNLLNSQWDEYLGMGAQKTGVLAGINLVF